MPWNPAVEFHLWLAGSGRNCAYARRVQSAQFTVARTSGSKSIVRCLSRVRDARVRKSLGWKCCSCLLCLTSVSASTNSLHLGPETTCKFDKALPYFINWARLRVVISEDLIYLKNWNLISLGMK